MTSQIHLIVTETDAGQRLDKYLVGQLEAISRSRVQALIKSGHVSNSAGLLIDPGSVVRLDQHFNVVLPDAVPAEPQAEAIALNVVFEDDALIVVDKAAGLVVHPAAGHSSGTLVNALLAHCGESLSGVGGVKRPGIVHRLDKDTSGLLVVAKTDAAHQGLQAQFEAHGADGRLTRSYLALVWGVLDPVKGVIDAPLARSTHNRTRIAVAKAGGRHARTHYETLNRYVGADGVTSVATMVRAVLETGRTHQIRVHLAHIGHPVLGDRTYGAGFAASARRLSDPAQVALTKLGRQALHAAHLGFEHPVSGESLAFDSDPPPDMAALIAALDSAKSGLP